MGEMHIPNTDKIVRVYSVCVLQVMKIFIHHIENDGEIFRICYAEFSTVNALQHANRIYTIVLLTCKN